MKHIFIVGSKGIPANYGGYETFLEYLTKGKQSNEIKYHVACKVTDKKKMMPQRFEHNNADCFKVYVPNIGPAQAIYYDVAALNQSIKYVKEHQIEKPIFYILACRIGPFMNSIVRRVHALGGVVYVNPDGHEWLRAKWSKPVRSYWKYSEGLMVKHADLLICDSKNIEKYIQSSYKKYQPKTTFIAYGADVKKSQLADDNPKLINWFNKFSIKANNYYLIVGRFVPENNYETMIREFMASNTKKDLVIITNVERNHFYDELKEKTHFENDPRIKFVGTVYDAELLAKIRELAYGYLHGHSVGGTNPSLLEALASTKLNLLYDVGFNREVGEDGALYWSKTKQSLSQLINSSDILTKEEICLFGRKSDKRVIDNYSWERIVDAYETQFLNR
ncbi:beta 1-4 rhamnosyltransferase Cps2T [Lapidilactobacillus wuchangensis]|uniref:beta 1-4 rhamnosyltransferase Cps2T n=1 Tax=Lapidilactobacillus wuchangensis TaxID=2486001 RepID=UPI000F7A9E0E|nr:glycosyltransferase family 1 protein [Lapidilactobacillus wuchangensis]